VPSTAERSPRGLTAPDTPGGTAPVSDETLGELDEAMPTGVSVSRTGRVFVCYPKWGDEVVFTVGELRDGGVVAFPSQELNDNRSDVDPERLVSVQSIVVDPADRLWLLDTGSPVFAPTDHGGPKLVCVDLTTDTVVRTILFPTDVADDDPELDREEQRLEEVLASNLCRCTGYVGIRKAVVRAALELRGEP
jgi:hypothetical protein